MRIFRILGIAVGGLIALVALALVAVWLLVDPNDYKDRIAVAVKQSTGRTLALPGKLKLAVFPWLAIETGEASLGNPAGFGDAPFLTLKHARLSVKLLPLLHKQLEVGRIWIDGLDLRLKQNAAGEGNWEKWQGESAQAGSPAAGSAAPTDLHLAGMTISNSRVAFEGMVAQNVNIDIGGVAPGKPIAVAMKMDLVTAPKAKPLPFSVAFNLAVDLAAQTLAETTFKASVGSAQLQGSVTGRKLVDAPALSGHFELAEVAPRKLMQEFGIVPPVTRDASRLGRFRAQGNYAWAKRVVRADGLSVQLDDSRLTGRVAYDTATGGMDFGLTLDRINLDSYQPPPTASVTKSEPIELPVDLLKALRAKGVFNVGEIQIGGAHLTKLSAGIAVRDAVARFGPLQAQLYGGQYNGNIGLDMRPAVPRLTMDEHMSGIDIAALMKDYADTKKLSGRGNLDVTLAASGRNGDALLKTLNGTISTSLQNGAVEGIDIWYAIAQAQSLLQKRALADATNNKRTAFDTFKASADVVNGVATTRDLAIASQLLRITGQGSTNLVTQALDYSVTATVLKTPPGAGDDATLLARASIPVKITGTFADPKVRPDLTGAAKERVKVEVQKQEEKVAKKVKNKLKDLFGR